MTKDATNKTRIKMGSREKSRLIFYISLMVYPVIQFSIFYIYVNINSVKMAFWSLVPKENGVGWDNVFTGIQNFKDAFEILISKNYMLINSLKFFAIKIALGFTLAILFSFYIYKKYPLAGFFKVILFMPQIISALIFSVLFLQILDKVYPIIYEMFTGSVYVGDSLAKPSSTTSYTIAVIFTVWVSFGIDILMLSNAMSGISEDSVEAAQIDGVNIFQEFYYITLPSIYPTLVSLLIIMTTGIFTDQLNLYSLFAENIEDSGTLGYYLYKHAIYLTTQDNTEPTFSQLSAIGVILTLIMVPLTLGLRKICNSFGPSDEREGKVK